ncbi:bifunctional UDP-N-acetylglucosamine diphosphorylase/glucosamine-1-phosphate N-acetyltransferase GlmU [Actinopolyspora mortivallis]|uniref:Bifunctional protein GlmU n=1 Tax=Actinopolyspora mortivallis TaxID=33906 RepID=A0A2T0GXE8_ACTMO|nr:bifunctional UDP-N-acetylglucosamine diphosphorylase/glucosamine-1-phosphate N-acetyltransferase GlmU [Actinopolyspora mortivallis]PRW63767.1 bifunctional UDP-N-acetylglucosamine diphosphorylase/glucosamine-1-phosphate N-acetyltransferase GlmU [Actinopolyspora mortivallis]
MLEGVTAQPPSDGMSSDPVSVLVLAAGEGTRMKSATPKVLHRIAGRPLLEHAVRAAAGVAPDELSVVIGHGGQAVGEHLTRLRSELDREITPVVQHEQLGTGHAVRCATEQRRPRGTVLVTYGDIPLLDAETLGSLLREHRRRGDAVTVLTAVVEDPHGYGRILRDHEGEVTAIVEQKDATPEQAAVPEINSGVYAFDAEFLTEALRLLSTDNSQGELYLTDVIEIARQRGRGTGALVCADNWLVEGVNDRVQLASVAAEYNRRLLRHWMREGVTVTDPSSVWVDGGVTLGRDVVLEPNVQLRGHTSVAEGAQVGPDTTLTDCVVATGARVVRTHGENAEVAPHASVGPFAYLRSGTRVGAEGKVGTFVEAKNAEIGAGSKVPHLSYVGDATIGEHSNIGAATVFVNYDGVAKHHTVIGSHARTGADNMFVAPVRVEDGAYTAAGSVITEDVPPGAMAVARGRQRNIEGWVAEKRPGTAADEAARRALADRDQSAETDE